MQRPSAATKRAAPSPSRAAGASVSSATCKPESRNKPAKPAIQISDADHHGRRKILFLESRFQDPVPNPNGTRRVTMPQVLTRRRGPTTLQPGEVTCTYKPTGPTTSKWLSPTRPKPTFPLPGLTAQKSEFPPGLCHCPTCQCHRHWNCHRPPQSLLMHHRAIGGRILNAKISRLCQGTSSPALAGVPQWTLGFAQWASL
jgi:hypothetical protein